MKHLLFFLITVSVFSLQAGTLSLNWSTDKEPISYRPQEPIVFKVQLVDDEEPVIGKTLKWVRTGDDQKMAEGQAVSAAVPLEIITSTDQPGFVYLAISVFNPDGTPVMDSGKPLTFHGGAGVEPTKLESYPEPPGFDAFWDRQKARLADVPIKSGVQEVDSKNPRFRVFDVKVDCAGGKPVLGYLTIPKGAKPKSLPITVRFRGYAVCGADPFFQDDMITFEINAHGIENGREPAYYDDLKNGELKGYGFDSVQNAAPETAYFNGMFLRVMRALQYVKTRPEWDGKTLTALGGSQGGFQSVAAAALDHDVTQCTANIPWCCDLGGVNFHRVRGWRPDYTEALGYYDPVNMVKRIRCPLTTRTGLGDTVCPPSGVSVLYNNAKVPKTIKYVQGATHGYTPPNPDEQILSEE